MRAGNNSCSKRGHKWIPSASDTPYLCNVQVNTDVASFLAVIVDRRQRITTCCFHCGLLACVWKQTPVTYIIWFAFHLPNICHSCYFLICINKHEFTFNCSRCHVSSCMAWVLQNRDGKLTWLGSLGGNPTVASTPVFCDREQLIPDKKIRNIYIYIFSGWRGQERPSIF